MTENKTTKIQNIIDDLNFDAESLNFVFKESKLVNETITALLFPLNSLYQIDTYSYAQYVKDLRNKVLKQVFEQLNKIENEEQRKQVLDKYAQFNPDYKRPLEKPQFFKMGNLLKGTENE